MDDQLPLHGERETCLRCLKPEATPNDDAIWRGIYEDDWVKPDDWPDDEGSHMCWRAVADGDCYPDGPSPRVTSGHLVLHDGCALLLSAPVADVIAALRDAGALPPSEPTSG